MVILVVAAALIAGRANLDAAKEVRLADRAALVERFGTAGEQTYAHSTVESLTLSPDDPAANEAAIARVTAGSSGQALVAVAVVDRSGDLIGSRPADLTLPPAAIDGTLDWTMSEGLPSITPVFELDGEPVWAQFEPVGAPEPWGALVMIEPLTTGWLQDLYEGLGSMSGDEGGITLLDDNGVVAASWDPTRVGEPSPLNGLLGDDGDRRVTEVSVDGEETTYIASTHAGGTRTMVFEQSSATLFGDLEAAQAQRDRMVVAAAALAIVLLGLLTWLRQRAVRKAHARTNALLAMAHDIVLLVDDHGVIRFASPTVATLLGCEESDVVDRRLHDLVAGAHTGRLADAVEMVARESEAELLGVQLRCADGQARWFDLHLAKDPDPALPGVLVTCHEIGDRRALEEVLAHRASHDALTDLGNRSTFDRSLAALALRDGPLSVMVIDLDHFKPLNDSLGHDAGDAALRAVAACLRDAVRTTDVVCRLGGDEFGVILPNTEGPNARLRADRIIDAIRDSWPSIDGSVELDASIGIATADGPVDHPAQMVRDADAAMYRAKQAGGGSVATTLTSSPAPAAVAPAIAAMERSSATKLDEDARTRSSAPVPAEGGASGRVLSSARASAATWIVTVALAAGMASGGVFVANEASERLERDRVEDRASLLVAISDLNGELFDRDALIETVASSPWGDMADPALVEYILGFYASSPALQPDGFAVMLDIDGSVVAASPPGTPVAVDTTSSLWSDVADGIGYTEPVAYIDGRPITQLVVPVTSADPVEHVLVMGTDPSTAGWSDSLASLGSLTDHPGGISLVDGNGRSTISWNTQTIGTQIVDPALLEDAPVGEPIVERVDHDGAETVVIATVLPGSRPTSYAVWTQDASTLFADLHAGQRTRDAALVAIVIIALVGFTIVGRRDERALRNTERRFAALLQHAHDIVVVLGPDRSIRFVSAAAQTQLGTAPDSVLGQPLHALIGAEPAATIDRAIDAMRGGRTHAFDGQELTAADGSTRWFDVDVTDVRAHAGIAGILITFHDVSARVRLEGLLTEQATTDPLTGLLNRAEFGSRLDDLSSRRSRQVGSDAILFIDLDHFKPINDTLGHHAGDEVLRVVAERLTATVRSHDIVCRLGGDEFALLLVDCDLELARATVERLLVAIRQPVPVSNGVATVDASVGIALSRTEITNAEELVRAADQAMYQAKRDGRGRYVVGA